MKSVCLDCPKKDEDKNKCSRDCEKLKEFQEKYKTNYYNLSIFTDDVVKSCFCSGGSRVQKKPPHL